MISICDEVLTKKLRLEAFKHYVSAWKKQDPDTVTVEGDIYSYRTKRGLVKRFRATEKVTCLKVETFYFEDLN